MAVLSRGRLSKMMLEKLLEFPSGAKHLKENVTLRLGMVGQLSTSREINAAWNETKTKAARLHSDRFILDGRGVLHWNDGSVKILALTPIFSTPPCANTKCTTKISAVHFTKCNYPTSVFFV